MVLSVEAMETLLSSATTAIDSLSGRLTEIINAIHAQQARMDTIVTVLNNTVNAQAVNTTGIHNLGTHTDALRAQVSALSATISRTPAAVAAGTSSGKGVVAKPSMFNGNGDLSASRFFLATFVNWAQNQGNQMNTANPAGGWTRDDQKWIGSVLNFLTDKAQSWALPYLETIGTGKPAYRDWVEFETAFRRRFEPVDVKTTAQHALEGLSQGKGSVEQYKAKFDEHAPRTGWPDTVLAREFRDGLTERVKDVMINLTYNKEVLDEVYRAAQIAGERIRDRNQEKSGKGRHSTTSSIPAPDAMDIDATRVTKAPTPVKGAGPNGKTYDDFKRAMVNKCSKCGSSDHIAKNGNHERDVCYHCKKVGHRSTACMRKFMGHPVTQQVNADAGTSTAPSGSGQTQGVATVGNADTTVKMKELEEKIAALMKEQEAIKAAF